jgi:hypothetical protein
LIDVNHSVLHDAGPWLLAKLWIYLLLRVFWYQRLGLGNEAVIVRVDYYDIFEMVGAHAGCQQPRNTAQRSRIS